ncbi:MAG: TlpA disulfide reductase family protein [Marinifilaceae bacterium]
MKLFKIITLLVFCALTSVNAQTSKADKFKLSVDIKGLNSTSSGYFFNDKSVSNGYTKVNFKINADKFTIEGNVPQPTLVKMYFSNNKLQKAVGTNSFIPTNATLLLFIAMPGKEIKVKGSALDYINAYPYGDLENNTLSKLTKKLHPILNKSVNIEIKCSNDKTLSASKVEELKKQMSSLNEQANNIRLSFLKKHSSSIAGLWLLEDMLIRSQISMEVVEKHLKRVSSKYHSLDYYKDLKTRIDGYNSTKVGKHINLSTTNTLDGKPFDIKDLKGKYVLLDFWGTWCGACCSGMPSLREFRDKHIDKLRVVAVNCGDSFKRWKSSKFTKTYNWIHIKSDKKANNFVNQFNVQGYPTKILISPEGKILYRYVGEDPSLYNEIENLIK